jgi:uncharacterized protein YbaP (TraB family)
MREKRFGRGVQSARGLWVLATLFLLLVSGAWAADGHGLLWQVEAGGTPSYLFGTVHSDDPRVLDLAPTVRQALADSERLVLEMSLDPGSIASVGRAMFFGDGDSLPAVLDPDLYQQTLEAMAERGYPESVVAMMRPWAVVATLAMPPARTGEFLDRHLMQLALAEGKPIFGLESVEEQVAVLGGLSTQDQASMLAETIRQLDDYDARFERLITLYLARDLEGLRRFQQELYGEGDSHIAELFEERAIRVRNHRMVERMQTHLEAGGAFVAVGALHLPGPEGLLALLRERGMSVKRMY